MTGREQPVVLVRVLRLTGALAFVLALPAVVMGARVGAWVAWLMAGVLIAAPLARVAYLCGQWLRPGDRRFAAAAAGLLSLVAVGTAIALVSGRPGGA